MKISTPMYQYEFSHFVLFLNMEYKEKKKAMRFYLIGNRQCVKTGSTPELRTVAIYGTCKV